MSLITSKQVRMSAIKTPLMGLSGGVTFLPVHLTDCLADVVLLAQDNQGIMSGRLASKFNRRIQRVRGVFHVVRYINPRLT